MAVEKDGTTRVGSHPGGAAGCSQSKSPPTAADWSPAAGRLRCRTWRNVGQTRTSTVVEHDTRPRPMAHRLCRRARPVRLRGLHGLRSLLGRRLGLSGSHRVCGGHRGQLGAALAVGFARIIVSEVEIRNI